MALGYLNTCHLGVNPQGDVPLSITRDSRATLARPQPESKELALESPNF
jgi:hypothetical protein